MCRSDSGIEAYVASNVQYQASTDPEYQALLSQRQQLQDPEAQAAMVRCPPHLLCSPQCIVLPACMTCCFGVAPQNNPPSDFLLEPISGQLQIRCSTADSSANPSLLQLRLGTHVTASQGSSGAVCCPAGQHDQGTEGCRPGIRVQAR